MTMTVSTALYNLRDWNQQRSAADCLPCCPAMLAGSSVISCAVVVHPVSYFV